MQRHTQYIIYYQRETLVNIITENLNLYFVISSIIRDKLSQIYVKKGIQMSFIEQPANACECHLAFNIRAELYSQDNALSRIFTSPGNYSHTLCPYHKSEYYIRNSYSYTFRRFKLEDGRTIKPTITASHSLLVKQSGTVQVRINIPEVNARDEACKYVYAACAERNASFSFLCHPSPVYLIKLARRICQQFLTSDEAVIRTGRIRRAPYDRVLCTELNIIRDAA